ncbi:MAG: glutamine synthetase family protein [Verrucomicrobiota bacterium]
MTLDELRKKIEAGEIDTVALVFPDVCGRLVGKRFTGKFFVDSVAEHGTHACNYLITLSIELDPWDDFTVSNWEKGFGDFHLRPDWDSLRLVPWLPGTALLLADVFHADQTPVEETPRSVLRRQIAALAERGFRCCIASELEFFLYNCDYPAAYQARYHDLAASSEHRIDYNILQPSRDESIFREIRNLMPLAGVPIESSKGEWGRGQHEVNFSYADPLTMADQHTFFKHGAKELVQAQGKCITFMAKPSATEPGSSCHIHLSLFQNEKNAFWNPSHPEGSPTFRAFLGGLIKYAPDFALFFAPTINSYKRYLALTWAPTKMAWAFDNRTVGFRVVGSGASFRLENRLPGADANAYLAFAAMLAAGMAGIEEGLDCGAAYRGNAYVDSALTALPRTLNEAADSFSASRVTRAALGDHVVDFYTLTARHEISEFQGAVTDWERMRYFERI